MGLVMIYEFKVHNKDPDHYRKVSRRWRSSKETLSWPQPFSWMPEAVRGKMAVLDAASDDKGNAVIEGVGKKDKYNLGYHYRIRI